MTAIDPHRNPLPIAAIAFASLAIAGLYLPGAHGLYLACKPLATLAVIALAWRMADDGSGYRRAVLAGLWLSLLGDIALMWPERWFVAGLASFLLAHLAYLQAYRRRARLFALAWPFALYGVLAAGVFAILWPHLPGELRVPVGVYVVALAAMAAQALVAWRVRRDPATRLAAIGGACFLVSDAILAIDRFVQPFLAAPALLLALYWAAQLLIASSVRTSPGR